MAKCECRLRGDLDTILSAIDARILGESISASYEDGSSFTAGGTRCEVRVYERYSYTGGNRVSLSITLLGSGQDIFLSAISSGGSQAVFFKFNTWGEEAFLEQIYDVIRPWSVQ